MNDVAGHFVGANLFATGESEVVRVANKFAPTKMGRATSPTVSDRSLARRLRAPLY